MQLATFLVERYLPGERLGDVVGALDRLRAESERLAASGEAIRYLGSLLIGEDETCLCHFEARSRETVVQANESARAPFARIVAGEWIAGATRRKESR
jgi:hypothetical protein